MIILYLVILIFDSGNQDLILLSLPFIYVLMKSVTNITLKRFCNEIILDITNFCRRLKSNLLKYSVLKTPVVSIDKHLNPGRLLQSLHIVRNIRPLPHLSTSLRMRHHCQMSSIRTTKSCDSKNTSIWIQGIPID